MEQKGRNRQLCQTKWLFSSLLLIFKWKKTWSSLWEITISLQTGAWNAPFTPFSQRGNSKNLDRRTPAQIEKCCPKLQCLAMLCQWQWAAYNTASIEKSKRIMTLQIVIFALCNTQSVRIRRSALRFSSRPWRPLAHIIICPQTQRAFWNV